MSIEDDIAFFERVPTLRLLGRTALRILAIGAETRYIHDGELLFTAGDTSDGGYVIQEGVFGLQSAGRSDGVVVGPGTLLGELALLAETKRPATAIAREPSTVIRISRSLFLKMLEGYPDLAYRLRNSIAARTTQMIGEMVLVRSMLHHEEDAGVKPAVAEKAEPVAEPVSEEAAEPAAEKASEE